MRNEVDRPLFPEKDASRLAVPDAMASGGAAIPPVSESSQGPVSPTVAKEKIAESEKDYLLKLETAQALCSAGYFVRTNVALSEQSISPRGAQKLADITDVDVFGVAFAMDFHPDTLCVSCKAGSSKGLSPIKETLMMAGVMKYLRAERGYAIFSDRKIDPHMYSLAHQLGIALFSLEEWELWKKRQVGNRAAPAHLQPDVYVAIKDLCAKRNDLEGLWRYTRGEYWYYRDFRNIQNLVGVTRKFSKALSGTPAGRFAFLDVLSLFAISVLQLCEYATFTGAGKLAETVPPYLFGGISVYKSRRELLRRVEEMFREREVLERGQQFPSLDPPYVQDLAEVVARYLQKPVDAVRVPQHINFQVGNVASQAVGGLLGRQDSGESETTQKFAHDLAGVLVRAAGVDKEVLTLL